eukprot:tig00001299_g8060.t1
MLSKSGIGRWTINLNDEPRKAEKQEKPRTRRKASVIAAAREEQREALRKQKSNLENFLISLGKREAQKGFDLLMRLRTKNMGEIEEAFEASAELTLPAFVSTLRAFLPPPESDEEEEAITSNLIDLFEQVDALGEGTITWTEFTAFIVEQGISASQQTFVDVIRNYNPSPVQDGAMRQQPIERVVYVPACDKIAIAERFSSRLQLVDPDTLEVVTTFCERPGPPSTFVAMEPIAEMEVLAAASSNHTLSFFDYVHGKTGTAAPHLTRDLKTNDGAMIRTLRWCPATSTLFSGDALGVVRLWRTDTPPPTGVPGPQDWRAAHTMKGAHGEAVTAIALLDSIDTIATAGADRRIKLFNVHTMTLRRELGSPASPRHNLNPDRDGHRQGIYGLAFNAEYRYLFSSGFDADVFVWNPFMERLVGRLSGHKRPLVGIATVPDTPQLVSADTAGVIRVWDIRKMDSGSCVQEFSRAQALAAMQGPSSLFQTLTQGGAGGERGHGGPLTASSILGRSQDVTAFCVIPEMKRIVAADKRLLVWEYGESGDRSLTDPHACVAAHFSPERMQILTAAGRSVRHWDAETGRLIRVDRDIVPQAPPPGPAPRRPAALAETGRARQGEVTAMTVGPGGRRYYIGDTKGRVACHSSVQGALVKLYERHRADVTAIAHVPADRTLVTASRDATIYVHDDSNLTGGILLRTIVAHANEVSCLALAPALGLIASGSIDSTVAVWDYGSARLEGLAPGHEADVTAIALLDPRPLLVTACSQGFLNFYLTRPAPYANRHELLLSHRNTAPDGAPSPVLALALDDGAGQQGAGGAGPLLYTGDDAGQVRVWSLRRLFEFVDSFLAATLAAAPPPPGTRPDAPPRPWRRAGAPAPPRGAVHAAAVGGGAAAVNAVAETGRTARMQRVSVLVNAQDRLAAQAASGSRAPPSQAPALLAFRRPDPAEAGDPGPEAPDAEAGGRGEAEGAG